MFLACWNKHHYIGVLIITTSLSHNLLIFCRTHVLFHTHMYRLFETNSMQLIFLRADATKSADFRQILIKLELLYIEMCFYCFVCHYFRTCQSIQKELQSHMNSLLNILWSSHLVKSSVIWGTNLYMKLLCRCSTQSFFAFSELVSVWEARCS